jgi:hypothetical protein
LSVQDTGPGIDGTPLMEVAQQLHDATEIADEARRGEHGTAARPERMLRPGSQR